MKPTTIHLFYFGCLFLGCPSFAETVGGSLANELPSITVTGTGEVLAQPDMARVSIGVVTQLSTAAEALRMNTEAVEKLMAALAAHGVAERDIQTSEFGVSPQYDYDRSGQPPRLIGYRVSNQVRVAVRRIDDLGTVLDEVVTAGANQINGVGFEIAEAESLEDTARRLAMRDARRKAELYGKEAGVRLGPVLAVVEAAAAVPVPQYAMGVVQEARAVPIAPGELTLRQEVRVTFAIEAER